MSTSYFCKAFSHRLLNIVSALPLSTYVPYVLVGGGDNETDCINSGGVQYYLPILLFV